MFCHDKYSLLFSREKKQHDRINTCEETMGQKEGMEREQVTACTAGSNLLCATGQKAASARAMWRMG
jgi:hypothetical protein